MRETVNIHTRVYERMPEGKTKTTIGLYQDTKRRFDEAKPFDSLSADEFLHELLDEWGGGGG